MTHARIPFACWLGRWRASFRNNQITDEGGQVLLAALGENKTITALQYVFAGDVKGCIQRARAHISYFTSRVPGVSSHYGNDFSASFAATLSAALKTRKIDSTEEDVPKSPIDRKTSFFRRPSSKEAPARQSIL